MERLKDKVAVITGAASGIGLAIARRFHDEGAKVVVADISGKEIGVAAEFGARALAVRADVTSSADVQAMMRAAVTKFGGIDILCNNAGIDGDMTPLADVTEDNFDRIVAINLRGVFLGLKYGIPLMKARGGSIINIASTAGITASPGLGVYGATKAGVMSLSRSAAVEYALDKIRVNAICPATTETPLVAHLVNLYPEAAKRVLDKTPIGRIAQPEEIAAVALFLASDESSYVTGTSMPVDGAYTVF